MMKQFDDETFSKILSLKGIKISDYIKNGDYENMLLRPVRIDDHSKGLLELMFDDVSDRLEREQIFKEYLTNCEACPGTYYTVVVEDLWRKQIIASGTLIVEQKFIHGAAVRGRIENMIVHPDFRRRRVGSVVLGLLTFLAERIGCYKTTLNCPEDIIQFYEEMKYAGEAGQNFMIIHFKNNKKNASASTSPRPTTYSPTLNQQSKM